MKWFYKYEQVYFINEDTEDMQIKRKGILNKNKGRGCQNGREELEIK